MNHIKPKPKFKIHTKEFYNKVRYQIRYIDYEKNQWTVPVLLTPARYEKFAADKSVEEVKFVPMLGEDTIDSSLVGGQSVSEILLTIK